MNTNNKKGRPSKPDSIFKDDEKKKEYMRNYCKEYYKKNKISNKRKCKIILEGKEYTFNTKQELLKLIKWC